MLDLPALGLTGGLVLFAVAGGMVALALFWGRDAGASRRVILAFLFRVALPVLLLLGAPLVVLSQVVMLDPRVWQALIAGAVIAAGWLTSAVFTETRRAQEKAEKLRDYHKALYAEIGDTLSAYYLDGQADAFGQELLERMAQEPEFVPFIPREAHDRVYAALLEEIEVLPRVTIDHVVAFYSLVSSIAALTEDMRSDRFMALEQPRRMAVYADYLSLRRNAFTLGSRTLRLISIYSEKGAEAARAFVATVSSPDAGLSRPAAGSE